MRAVSLTATALMLLAASAVVATASGWPRPRMFTNWEVQLPAPGMQLSPAYTSVNGMYIATTTDGSVSAVNTSTRAVQWSKKYDDISFVAALPSNANIFVARYSGTTVLDSTTGELIWFNPNVTMAADLSEPHNALVFDNTIVYRDQSMGFVRLCAVDGLTGNQQWCDKRRVYGTPDYAANNTFTAVFFDVNMSSYSANVNAMTGEENWFAYAPLVYSGSPKYVGVRDGPFLIIVSAMSGLRISQIDVSQFAAITSAVFVGDQFFFTDGNFWVAALDCQSGTITWNVTAPSQNPDRRVELQQDTPGILVAALLSDVHTNFTRLNMRTGANMWTVTARPTGMSIAPVHAWLGTDILYVRNVNNSWSAWGADSGLEISGGSGDLFLPRSVRASFTRPHSAWYVTSNAGKVMELLVESRR